MISLAVTPLFLGLSLMLLVFLSVRVIRLRRTLSIGIGNGESVELARAVRVHGNFIEYTPFALLTLLCMELLGFHLGLLRGWGALFLAGRILHAWGMSTSDGASFGRVGGMILTFTCLLVAGGLCLLAAIDPALVRSFQHP